MQTNYDKAAGQNTLIILGDQISRWLCCLQMFCARLSVTFASEMSQLGTCIKTLTRAWVGGCTVPVFLRLQASSSAKVLMVNNNMREPIRQQTYTRYLMLEEK